MKPIDELPESEWLDLVREAASLSEVPLSAVRASLELWRDHAPAAPLPAGARVRRWIAALTFDSWAAHPTEAGVRGAIGDARRVLFAAAGRDFDLRIVPLASGFVLKGQHFGPDGHGVVECRALDAPGPGPQHRVELTPSGEFSVELADGGAYVLEFALGDDRIVLPPLAVGSSGGGP